MVFRSRVALVALAVVGAALTAGISAGPAQAASGVPIRVQTLSRASGPTR